MRRQSRNAASELYATCASCHGANGAGHLGDECAAPREHERLVHGSDSCRISGRAFAARHPQDFNGAQMASMARVSAGRSGDQRSARLRAHAVDGVGRELSSEELSDGIRRNRRPRSRARAARSADLHPQVHLEPGSQGDRDPVRRSSRSRIGLVALVHVGADAPAARLPATRSRSSRRRTITSTSPCTA